MTVAISKRQILLGKGVLRVEKRLSPNIVLISHPLRQRKLIFYVARFNRSNQRAKEMQLANREISLN